MTELLHSPLHDRHEAAGAKFAEFGGWAMPLEYAGGGILAEHQVVRDHVGLFDVSHLGKMLVKGPGAKDFCNRVFTNDLGKIAPGKAQYSMLCNERGGVIDDLICYLVSDDEVFIIPNAANCATVVDIVQSLAHRSGAQLEVTNLHREFAVIAVQGPESDEVVASLGLPTDMSYMAFAHADHDGVPYTVCRTGYTGERGYELVVPAEAAGGIWDALMAAGEQFGIRPCGLGARDTLRTEMGYSLHGNDISPDIDPVSAGLSWAIGWKKESFEGHEALRAIKTDGPARTLRGLLAVGRGIPRHAMVVVDEQGNEIGEVTSGTFSPTKKQGIGLALVDSRYALGDEVGVQVRNRVEKFTLVKPPFVEPEVK